MRHNRNVNFAHSMRNLVPLQAAQLLIPTTALGLELQLELA